MDRRDILQILSCIIRQRRFRPWIPRLPLETWVRLRKDILRKALETTGDGLVGVLVTELVIRHMENHDARTRDLIATVLQENEAFYLLLEGCNYVLPQVFRKAGGNAFETVLAAWAELEDVGTEDVDEWGADNFLVPIHILMDVLEGVTGLRLRRTTYPQPARPHAATHSAVAVISPLIRPLPRATKIDLGENHLPRHGTMSSTNRPGAKDRARVDVPHGLVIPASIRVTRDTTGILLTNPLCAKGGLDDHVNPAPTLVPTTSIPEGEVEWRIGALVEDDPRGRRESQQRRGESASSSPHLRWNRRGRSERHRTLSPYRPDDELEEGELADLEGELGQDTAGDSENAALKPHQDY
ncbi:hypothetical protein B0H16DRAFT_1475607 [Mycena metata]|uniref:Uncharacterized protein n=1 Tax=Mycena metata TaxID=1033252 RepID=A0AAD7MIE7_9AGAR|nr:hypothetical protein B0H16DRAFT_1475607 [Mycena metata]